MNERYIRSLGPRVLVYIEQQAKENPESWQQLLEIAHAFRLFTEQENLSVADAGRILRQAEACGDCGSAWLEMKLALRAIAS
jgi:hypothetical protein